MNNPTGSITPYFKWSEVLCHGSRPGGVHEGVECEIPPDAQKNLIKIIRQVIQPLRAWLGAPVRIISGYRCPVHNEAVGGAEHSQHMLGNAVDIDSDSVSPACVYEGLSSHMFYKNPLGPGFLKCYPTWVHIDIRGHDDGPTD